MMLSIKIYKLQSASIRLKLSQLCIDCSHGYSAHPNDQVGQKTLLPKHISFFSAIKGFIISLQTKADSLHAFLTILKCTEFYYRC